MIIGMGSDLIDIRRIEKTLERFGQRFIERCFAEEEILKAERRRGNPEPISPPTPNAFCSQRGLFKSFGDRV